MSYTGQLSTRHRLVSGVGTALIVSLVATVLASGFDVPIARQAQKAIAAVLLPAPQREEPPPRAAPSTDRPSGKASAANKTAKAAPVAAPQPKIIPLVEPTIPAAPTPGTGVQASAGGASTARPGSGGGGTGSGTGTGGSGTGFGGASRPVWIGGAIHNRDYPRAASRAGSEGEVAVRFTVQPSGRVTACRVTRSSGDAALDEVTCRLIEERFRFRPARDVTGRTIASDYGWRQRWWLENWR